MQLVIQVVQNRMLEKNARTGTDETPFAIFTETIMHLVSPLPPPPPLHQKKCITIVFDFSRDDSNTQDKLETIVMQFFLWRGVNKVHYGLCENGKWCDLFVSSVPVHPIEWRMVNSFVCLVPVVPSPAWWFCTTWMTSRKGLRVRVSMAY